MLQQEISNVLTRSLCDSETTFEIFSQRLKENKLTRDENLQTHFCVFFLPYNTKNKKVFMVHHKKSGFWIAPGGHIDEGEGLQQTLNREVREELGVVDAYKESPRPFLFTLCEIENKVQPCKLHFDIWYLLESDGSDFKVDPTEFLSTKWMTIEEARKVVTVAENLSALKILESKHD